MITTTTCDCCDMETYHVELQKESLNFDGETLYYSMTRDDMQALYFALKEELLHGDS